MDQREKKLYNTAIVLDPTGTERGRRDKSFLWGRDNDWFTPGDVIEPVTTDLGKLGIVICADGRAPEIATGLVAQGAGVLVVPTCWVNVAGQPGQYANAQAQFMIAARAAECGVPVVAANKYGRETDELGYCGWSIICDPTGRELARAAPDHEALITAEIQAESAPPPVDVPRWAVRRIFSNDPPVLPDDDPANGEVGIAIAPGCMVAALAGEDHRGLRDLVAQGVGILGTCAVDEESAARFELYGRSMGLCVINYPYVERLMIERFGSFGCIAGEHARSFVPARVMALDGASIIFVVGGSADRSLLRTRAAENRVFVAACFERSAMLIDPAGQVIDECSQAKPQVVSAQVDLNQAACKKVFSMTDIWAQRRPDAYARAFGITRTFHPATTD